VRGNPIGEGSSIWRRRIEGGPFLTSPRLRGEVGAQRRVRGYQTNLVLESWREPLTPTL
jgi:hypothetical protein